MITYGNLDIIKYLDTYCEKAESRGIKVLKVNPKLETITFEIPVHRRDLEEALGGGENPWFATAKLEYSLDEDGDPILHRFPENLLDDEDYDFLCQCILDEI